MSYRRFLLHLALVAIVAGTLASPALAIFPQLHTTLSGPALNGRTPAGEAKLDQSRQPAEPGRLEVRVRNIALPDGSALTVNVGGTTPGTGDDVGTFVLNRGEGRLATTVPFQVGRSTDIAVTRGGQVILFALGWQS